MTPHLSPTEGVHAVSQVSGCVFVVAHAGSTVELCGAQPVPGVEVWQGNLDTIVAVPLCAEHRAFSGRHVVPARVAAAATLQLPLAEAL